MALLFMDGFGSSETAHKWDAVSSTFASLSATPRIPGMYYGQDSTGSAYKTITASAQVFMGFGFRNNSGLKDTSVTFYGDSGATAHITVEHSTATGVLEIRRGAAGGTLLASGTQPLLVGQWNYVEVSVTVADAGGQVHVRINGLTTDEVSYTGDTKNAGTSTNIDRILLRAGSNGANSTWFSDVYILNSTGAAPNNNFLGDVVVRTLSPSGNGTYSQLVGSDADSVNNYLLVDEHPFSATDYVGSATPGDKDTYAMADLPAGVAAVYGVHVNGLMAKSDASLGSARLIIRSGGTDYNGTTRALTTSYTGYYELYETNPATGVAWTPTNVNNLESGMEVV
jgi:hypothetical protein